MRYQELPGGLVAKTPRVPNAGGMGSFPGQGTKISLAAAKSLHAAILKN